MVKRAHLCYLIRNKIESTFLDQVSSILSWICLLVLKSSHLLIQKVHHLKLATRIKCLFRVQEFLNSQVLTLLIEKFLVKTILLLNRYAKSQELIFIQKNHSHYRFHYQVVFLFLSQFQLRVQFILLIRYFDYLLLIFLHVFVVLFTSVFKIFAPLVIVRCRNMIASILILLLCLIFYFLIFVV